MRLDLAADLAGERARRLEDRGSGAPRRRARRRRCGAWRGSRPARSPWISPSERTRWPTRPVGRGARRRARAGRRCPPKSATHAAHGPHERALARAPAHRLRERQAARRRGGTTSARTSAASRPGIVLRAATVLPRGESTTTRSATSTFCAFANPSAAFVGLPVLVEGARGGRAEDLRRNGPPGARGARGAPAARRRGVAYDSIAAGREAFLRQRLARGAGRAPAAPAAAPAPGSPPFGFPEESLGCSLVGPTDALGDRRSARPLKQPPAPARRAGDRCPSLPET